MSQQVANPSRSRLERDLLGDDFIRGELAGFWRDATVNWPYLDIEVQVGEYGYVAMHVQVDNYPGIAPAGALWDAEAGAPLPVDRWPVGGAAQRVWRPDWSPQNQGAPYLACDRVGLATHPDWANSHPGRAWNPSRNIVFYLTEVHRELADATMRSAADHG